MTINDASASGPNSSACSYYVLIQGSDNMVEETNSHPDSEGLQKLSPDSGQEERMLEGWVNAGGFVGAVCFVEVHDGEEKDFSDLVSCPYYSLWGLAVWGVVIPKPGCDAAAQDTL